MIRLAEKRGGILWKCGGPSSALPFNRVHAVPKSKPPFPLATGIATARRPSEASLDWKTIRRRNNENS
ncbi:MAG: hypothetical protein H0T47_03435 [Planctomycetaceae bacterium]|nr:hypothetical protein [Planctomycetaceae bacterium]